MGLNLLGNIPNFLKDPTQLNTTGDIRKIIIRVAKYATKSDREDIRLITEITATLIKVMQTTLHGAEPELQLEPALSFIRSGMSTARESIPTAQIIPFEGWKDVIEKLLVVRAVKKEQDQQPLHLSPAPASDKARARSSDGISPEQNKDQPRARDVPELRMKGTEDESAQRKSAPGAGLEAQN